MIIIPFNSFSYLFQGAKLINLYDFCPLFYKIFQKNMLFHYESDKILVILHLNTKLKVIKRKN